ncbi:MAG: radical SAM peptide maturase, CXXX-repeat target family [Spirochaetales bacterium]|nr:radical SAM peptide maturase, CXXX-repeat target family [Spirochaetales bacterium]
MIYIFHKLRYLIKMSTTGEKKIDRLLGEYDLSPFATDVNARLKRTVMVLITEECQLRCKYCYAVHKNNNSKIDFVTFRKAFDFMMKEKAIFSESGINIAFFGGEPLLGIKVINQICEYVEKVTREKKHVWADNYHFTISTNGILYNNPEVQEFIKRFKDHLTISISIDGTKIKHDMNRVYPDGKGSHDDIIKNIPLWQSQFPGLGTKATVSHDDIPYIKESILYLWDIGIKKININCVFEDVWKDGDDILFEEQLKQLADHIIENKLDDTYDCSFFAKMIGNKMDSTENNNWCGSGKHMTAIDTHGDFYACNRFLPFTIQTHDSRMLGNADKGFDKNKLRPYIALDRLSQSPRQCKECEYAGGCALCVGVNYEAAETDTIYQRAIFICAMHKARCRANNYYWEKRKEIGNL